MVMVSTKSVATQAGALHNMGQNLTSGDLWGNYITAIANGAGLPNADDVVLMGTAVPANFNTTYKPKHGTKPTKEEAGYQLFNLGDTMAGETAVYTATNQSFFHDYATYLDNLTPPGSHSPSPTELKTIATEQQALNKATNKWQAAVTKAFAAYTNDVMMFGKHQWADFAAWLAANPGGAPVHAAQAAVAGASTTLSTTMTKVYGSDYQAIASARQACDNVRKAMLGGAASGPAEMEVEDGLGAKRVVPSYGIGSLKVYSNWVKQTLTSPPKKPAVSASFNSTSGHANMSASSYYNHTDWHAGFWFFGAGGSSTQAGSQLNIDTGDSAFGITFEFEGITEIPNIAPGPWYDSSLMFGWKAPITGQQLSIPSSIICVIKPTITLKLDAKSYALAQSAYAQSKSLHVGGWFVSANHQSGSSSASMSAAWDSTNNTITLTQDNDQPVMVGMRMTEVVKGGIGTSVINLAETEGSLVPA